MYWQAVVAMRWAICSYALARFGDGGRSAAEVVKNTDAELPQKKMLKQMLLATKIVTFAKRSAAVYTKQKLFVQCDIFAHGRSDHDSSPSTSFSGRGSNECGACGRVFLAPNSGTS